MGLSFDELSVERKLGTGLADPVIGTELDSARVLCSPRRSAADFLKAVRDDSGLLTGWSGDQYGFMHLGFQEYLAAREIQRIFLSGYGKSDVLKQLADKFGQGWWQEVTLLLVALADHCLFEPFMREVVQHAAFAEHGSLGFQEPVQEGHGEGAVVDGRVSMERFPHVWKEHFAESQGLAAFGLLEDIAHQLPAFLDQITGVTPPGDGLGRVESMLLGVFVAHGRPAALSATVEPTAPAAFFGRVQTG